MEKTPIKTEFASCLRLSAWLQRGFNRLEVKLCVIVLSLAAAFLGPARSSAPDTRDDSLWSFRFDNLSVEDVLKELTRVTGIDVLTSRAPQNKRLTRSYDDETIEQIIRDVFRGLNYTLVWNYGEKGLESVGVLFFEEGVAGPYRLSPQGAENASRRAVEGDHDGGVPRARTSLVSSRRPSRMSAGAGGASSGQEKDEEAGSTDETEDEVQEDTEPSEPSTEGVDEATLTSETESEKETPDEPTGEEAGLPRDQEEDGPTS